MDRENLTQFKQCSDSIWLIIIRVIYLTTTKMGEKCYMYLLSGSCSRASSFISAIVHFWKINLSYSSCLPRSQLSQALPFFHPLSNGTKQSFLIIFSFFFKHMPWKESEKQSSDMMFMSLFNINKKSQKISTFLITLCPDFPQSVSVDLLLR